MLRSKEPYIKGMAPSYRSNRTVKRNEVQMLRAGYGMAEIVSGIKTCLKCDKDFFSEDIKSIRMCANCRDLAKTHV